MRARKGLRKIVIDDVTYYWKVSEDIDYYYMRELTVLNEQGNLFLKRRYSMDTVDGESTVHRHYDGLNPVITPSVVRSEILEEHEFNRIRAVLDRIEHREAPQQWQLVREFYHPEFIIGIGLDIEEDVLVYARQMAINSYRRTVVDLPSLSVLGEELIASVPENRENHTFLPTGPLRREVPCTRWNRSSEIIENQYGDRLCCYMVYPQYVYFQPAGDDCLRPKMNQRCVRLNKSHPYGKYGFSVSGDYLIIAERHDLAIWKRKELQK